jgi:hypothetical protein
LPPLPPPTHTTAIFVTPAGAVHEYVPAVVYASWPATIVILVSLIVKFVVVANMVPEVEPDLIDTVNVSAPSVVESAVGVTVNEPAFDVMVNEPELVVKSPALVSIDQ